MHKVNILLHSGNPKSLHNLVLFPNILTANCNTLTNNNDYFDSIKRRGFIYQQVTSLKINTLVKATNFT